MKHSRFNRFLKKTALRIGARTSKSFHYEMAAGTPSRKVFHRATRADLGVIKDVLINNAYAIPSKTHQDRLRVVYHRILDAGKTPLIIDAGANIGTSALWFFKEFEKSHVVAFEPDAGNAGLLEKNLAGLDADVRQAAIGSTDGFVTLVDPGYGHWGYQTKEAVGGQWKREAMNRVVSEKIVAGYVPFIVKIDIEGGEADLFESCTEWVDAFELLVIELHDWMLPGTANSFNFVKRIGQSKRDFFHAGENIFSMKLED